MYKMIFLSIIFLTANIWADQEHNHVMEMEAHSHEGHLHDTLVDGKALEVDPERFDNFMAGLSGSQIAIVSVNGMVCDFCARGIEKTFNCLLYTSPSPRDKRQSRMPSSA